jgi:hypothetical protein
MHTYYTQTDDRWYISYYGQRLWLGSTRLMLFLLPGQMVSLSSFWSVWAIVFNLKSNCDVNLLSKLSIIFKEWRVIVLFVLLRSPLQTLPVLLCHRFITIGRHWWCNGNDMSASSAIDCALKTNDFLLCQIICLKHRQDRRNMQPRYNWNIVESGVR